MPKCTFTTLFTEDLSQKCCSYSGVMFSFAEGQKVSDLTDYVKKNIAIVVECLAVEAENRTRQIPGFMPLYDDTAYFIKCSKLFYYFLNIVLRFISYQ